MRTRLWTVVMLAAVTVSARAQLRLPALPLPLPVLPVPQTLAQTVDQADAARGRLAAVRRDVVARLIGANRRLIEADADGEPIVRREILALTPSESALDGARALGFIVIREREIAAVGLRVVTLQAPANLPTGRALKTLRDADPAGTYDFNHVYTGAALGGAAAPTTGAPPEIGPGAPAAANPASIRVGLLDTGIDLTHPIFRDSTVHGWGCGDRQVPALHGTAVASRLLARARTDLFTADVYCGLPTGGAVDDILAGLAWLAGERVAVINVSLVGPSNVLLERAVAALTARGHLIVAAVGNDGPTAPPLYPAAYPDVVGVTGVDARHHVLLEAGRGPQVMFAALGADIEAANLEHGFAAVRGTSFAAPVVARLLAALLTEPDTAAAHAALLALSKQALDLGSPGRDLTYGFGLVGAGVPEKNSSVTEGSTAAGRISR